MNCHPCGKLYTMAHRPRNLETSAPTWAMNIHWPRQTSRGLTFGPRCRRPSRAQRGSGALLPPSVRARSASRAARNAPSRIGGGRRPSRAQRGSGALLPPSVRARSARAPQGQPSCAAALVGMLFCNWSKDPGGGRGEWFTPSADAILTLQIVYAELAPTQFCILSGSLTQFCILSGSGYG